MRPVSARPDAFSVELTRMTLIENIETYDERANAPGAVVS